MPLDDMDYRSARLTSTKIWQGDASNRPVEVDMPIGIPSGLITMWHGTIANIPAGWIICDGNNGTPNLLGRFVEGVATAATNPGTIGGATSKTTGGHTHTGGVHSHENPETSGASDTTPAMAGEDFAGTPDHIHSVGDTLEAGNVATTNNTDSIADIRPKYYDVAFIMKT